MPNHVSPCSECMVLRATHSFAPEMRGSSPCPYAVRQEACAACFSCEVLLAKVRSKREGEGMVHSAISLASLKKKILGKFISLNPLTSRFCGEQSGIRLRFRQLFTGMLSDVAFVPICCYGERLGPPEEPRAWYSYCWAGRRIIGGNHRQTVIARRSLPDDQFAKSAVSSDCLEF